MPNVDATLKGRYGKPYTLEAHSRRAQEAIAEREGYEPLELAVALSDLGMLLTWDTAE